MRWLPPVEVTEAGGDRLIRSLGPMALWLRLDWLDTEHLALNMWPSGGNDVGVRTLTKQECLDLLASVPIGRVALTLKALPIIFPVNYTLVGDSAVFGAMSGSPLSTAADGAVTAFQADSYDPENRTGWTVLAIGRALQITDAETLGQLDLDEKLPEPWAIGESGERYFRIDLSGVSGHRTE